MFLGMPAQPDGSTGLRSMRADAGYRMQSILHLSSLLSTLPTPPSRVSEQNINKKLLMNHCPETVPGAALPSQGHRVRLEHHHHILSSRHLGFGFCDSNMHSPRRLGRWLSGYRACCT